MSDASELVGQLVRAANRADRITDFERRKLFERTVIAVHEMRESIGMPVRTHADEIVDLQVRVAAHGLHAKTTEDLRAALLLAARMIRDLRITINSGFKT
ncbi:hypothetical protein ABID21_003628 [Pseudorhizobium tarimense]|uniref:Uncharacterized protein n=1 Tax=Pseudorhizobium tarimense TaxID=1079109 RepID=A0ABV2HAG5_9HYPH|nr:hypothetical protein [Pseudorhizobium tarimense]MCJ8520496.1 hypothetical protein [Pseudorhizobium tarimense]